MTAPQPVQVPPGHIIVTTHGVIREETVASLLALKDYIHKANLPAVLYPVSGNLVDKARNEAVMQLLADRQAAWLLQIDADMQFTPDVVDKLVLTAYQQVPWADIVGAWCPLRGDPYLPTIDTGTGTWEPTLPGQGPLEVIRTGGACILAKRHVFERMEAPWYGVRAAPRAIDTLAEFDNFCRIKFDGRNPFMRLPEWEQIQDCAAQEAYQQRAAAPHGVGMQWYHTVGEDSNFADKARALGFRIVVQTDAVCRHVDRKVIGPEDHRDAIKRVERQQDLACGIVA